VRWRRRHQRQRNSSTTIVANTAMPGRPLPPCRFSNWRFAARMPAVRRNGPSRQMNARYILTVCAVRASVFRVMQPWPREIQTGRIGEGWNAMVFHAQLPCHFLPHPSPMPMAQSACRHIAVLGGMAGSWKVLPGLAQAQPTFSATKRRNVGVGVGVLPGAGGQPIPQAGRRGWGR